MAVYVEKAVFDDAMCSENPVCRGLQKQIKTFEEGKYGNVHSIKLCVTMKYL